MADTGKTEAHENGNGTVVVRSTTKAKEWYRDYNERLRRLEWDEGESRAAALHVHVRRNVIG